MSSIAAATGGRPRGGVAGLLNRLAWGSGKDRRRRIGESPITPYLFILPHFAIFSAMVLFPFFLGIWISLHDSTALRDGPFVGLRWYQQLFDPSSFLFPRFWNSVWNTIIFVVISTPLLIGFGLALAVLLNQRLRGRNIFRAVYFVPWTLSVSVVGLTWWWMFNGNAGYSRVEPELAGHQSLGMDHDPHRDPVVDDRFQHHHSPGWHAGHQR
jgi:multiple sugar transport system permease protein